MNKSIFLNLPVHDAAKSKAFFEALGFAPNPQFSGEGGACIVINEAIYVMLASHEQFLHFAPKGICDTTVANEVLLTLQCESREEVDTLVRKAVSAGGKAHEEAQDHGFMYDHGFLDLDGHAWGVFWMNPAAPATCSGE
jgi:predicted lactoylglutathione lyase